MSLRILKPHPGWSKPGPVNWFHHRKPLLCAGVVYRNLVSFRFVVPEAVGHGKVLVSVQFWVFVCPGPVPRHLMLCLLLFLSLLTYTYGEKQEDFYKILGVSKDAKQKEIQRVTS